MRAHTSRCRSTNVVVSLVLANSSLATRARRILLFSFLSRLLTPPEKLFIAFLPWRAISSDGPGEGGRSGRENADGRREYAPGVLAVLRVCEGRERDRKKRKDLLLPECLYLCLNDWCVSQNSSGSASLGPHAPLGSAPLTQIHPGLYHLEDIMGNAWRGSLTPPKDSPVASRVKRSTNQLL